MIIWLFGQPGSGKTTIALELLKKVKARSGQWVHIDGDAVRLFFDNKDYSKEGRIKNGYFVISLCEFLQQQNFNVVVSLVTPYTEIRTAAQERLKNITLIELHYKSNRNKNQYAVLDYEATKPENNIMIVNTDTDIRYCLDIILKKAYLF